MNSKVLATILGAGILGACMMALPVDAAEVGPIQIEHVQANGGYYQDAIHDMNVLPASLEITFENRANVDASDVIFSIESNGFVNEIEDVGRFTKGIQIHHSFPINPFSVTDAPIVRVVRVSFVNGSTWQSPDAP